MQTGDWLGSGAQPWRLETLDHKDHERTIIPLSNNKFTRQQQKQHVYNRLYILPNIDFAAFLMYFEMTDILSPSFLCWIDLHKSD